MKCVRCGSNFLREEQDHYGKYIVCLTCGWTDNGIGLRGVGCSSTQMTDRQSKPSVRTRK